MSHISIDTFKELDLEDYLNLSRNEFSKPSATVSSDINWKDSYVEKLLTNTDHVRWKHLDSPFGASLFVRLIKSTKTVGRVLLQPRPFYSKSQKYNVACDMDMLVLKSFRSPPSNFINLIKASDDLNQFDFVFHTANEITHKLYGRLLGFPNPFSLQSYGFPLRLSGALSKFTGHRFNFLDFLMAPFHWLISIVTSIVYLMAGTNISKQPISDLDLDNLFQKCLKNSGPMLDRTNKFLKWRFGDSSDWPGDLYRIDHKGKLIGYFVTRQVKLGALSHLVLMDFMLDTDAPFICKISWRLWLLRAAIKANADTLFTMVNPFNKMTSKYVAFPIIRIPEWFLPHATPIFIRAHGSKNKRFESDRSMHMTLGDLDYF